MVTTRDFNASTKRQNRAVDAILKLGFFPSEIEIKSYDIWMQYNYKDTQHDDFRIVVVVHPSGQYDLIDYDKGCGVHTLEQVVEYFQKKIVYGNWFEFMIKSDYKQVASGSDEEATKFEAKRNLKGITNRQQMAIDTIIECISFPFNTEEEGCYVKMQYQYKNPANEDAFMVIIVGPSGNCDLVNNYGLCNEMSGTFTLKSLIEYLQMLITYGCRFDFQNNYRDNHKEDNKVKTHTMNDAVEMVLSEDYKERFIAEYVETKIRYERLHNIIIKWCAGRADFVTDIDLLEEQAKHMGSYLKTLEIRAVKEDIELPNVDWRN